MPVMPASPDGLQPNAKGLMPAVDHVGIVAYDLQPLIDTFVSLGFRVSAPEPLYGMQGGERVSLGQRSAHIVLSNFYIELSAPEPGRDDNHLVPYLEQYGPGVRILALACTEAASAHAAITARGLEVGDVRDASRSVAHAGGSIARFRWFPAVAGTGLSTLTCWVQQLTPHLVFDAAGRTSAWIAHSAVEVRAACDDPAVLCDQLASWAGAAGLDSEGPGLIPRRRDGSDRASGRSAVVDRLLLAGNDLARYRRHLDRLRIAYTEKDDSLWVPLPGLPGLQLGFVSCPEH
jgi:hypothetical protein